MRARRLIILMAMAGASAPAIAQVRSDAVTTLGRDLSAPADQGPRANTPLPTAEPGPTGASDVAASSVFVGAVNIDGGREIPRETLAPVIDRFVGKPADGTQLQAMTRAVADTARRQGYIFASAMVPPQAVEVGIVTIKLDLGAVDAVHVIGSRNQRLQRILDKIISAAARKEDVERQILLAGDLPGVEIISTRYVHDAAGAVLTVEVREDRQSGSIGVDNYGSHALGPARLHLRYDYTGLIEDGDVLTTQVVVTPLQPKELAYASTRYTATVGRSGTQVGVAAAVGQTKPGDSFSAGLVSGRSIYGAAFGSHPILRSRRASLWVNAELAYLHVEQDFAGTVAQRDTLVTMTLAGTGSVALGPGHLSGGLGVVQGLGGTGANDIYASRLDGSGGFTKGIVWLNWTGSLAKRLSLRLAANGQIASRPLLAAQEIGLGGPGFGRGYDFGERFGDDGVVGVVELREQFDKPMPGVSWLQLYGFVDGGYVDNLADGYGGGSLLSAGPGLRLAIGATEIGVEAAFPITTVRFDSGNKKPRINLTVGHNF